MWLFAESWYIHLKSQSAFGRHLDLQFQKEIAFKAYQYAKGYEKVKMFTTTGTRLSQPVQFMSSYSVLPTKACPGVSIFQLSNDLCLYITLWLYKCRIRHKIVCDMWMTLSACCVLLIKILFYEITNFLKFHLHISVLFVYKNWENSRQILFQIFSEQATNIFILGCGAWQCWRLCPSLFLLSVSRNLFQSEYESTQVLYIYHKNLFQSEYESTQVLYIYHKNLFQSEYESTQVLCIYHKNLFLSEYESTQVLCIYHKNLFQSEYESTQVFCIYHKNLFQSEYESTQVIYIYHMNLFQSEYESTQVLCIYHKNLFLSEYESTQVLYIYHMNLFQSEYESTQVIYIYHKNLFQSEYESTQVLYIYHMNLFQSEYESTQVLCIYHKNLLRCRVLQFILKWQSYL